MGFAAYSLKKCQNISKLCLFFVQNMNPFYIYALKDPRSSPARPFYIGKGTGIRAWEHTIHVDETRKGKRIAEIFASKTKVITTVLADDLTEVQALKLEAKLIAAFGTEENGGILTNSVQPSGVVNKPHKMLILPAGAREKAQIGLQFLKDAVLELSQANASGVTNSDVTKILGLQSDYAGGSKDYLSWSVLGILMREGKMEREDGSRKHRALIK
jgi:uncharacterized protein